MIEQKQVSELAMVPFKDAKELLYKLYSEGTWIISLIPVQKINNFYIPDIYIYSCIVTTVPPLFILINIL